MWFSTCASPTAGVRQSTMSSRLMAVLTSAGIRRPGNAEHIKRTTWDNMIGVNLTAVFLGCREVIPVMRARGAGAIINIASFNGLRGVPGVIAYSASKGGVVAMTMSLALDHASDNIRVNCVCPGVRRGRHVDVTPRL
jgi:NAD(P)-dependent dehydrogenase (short-subunit alcohol dehydrogenase family)